MRARSLRTLAVVAAMSLLAAACSKPASKDVEAGGKNAKDDVSDLVQATTPGAEEGAVAAPTTAPAAGTAAPGAKTTTGAPKTAVAGAADTAQARAVGAKIRPQTTTRPKPYYQGITDKAIKIAFGYDKETCGVNVVAALTAAGGALGTSGRYFRKAPTTPEDVAREFREAGDTLVKYWNDNAVQQIEFFPEVKKLTDQYNSPGHPLYGRKLEHVYVDSGSFQCPDKTRAAAVEAAETHKVFSVFQAYDGAQYNMASGLNTVPANRRPMHFGTYWLSDKIYDKFAPFAWTPFATGSTITRQKATYVCSKLVGGKASRTPHGPTKEKTRKFGLVHGNQQDEKLLANEFKGYLNQYCGKNIVATEIEYNSGDLSAAQSDSTNMIVQLKTADVTSVLMLTDPIFPLFQLGEANRQQYYPEWIWSSYGFADSNTVQRLYKDQGEQNAASFGVTQLGIPGGFGVAESDPFLTWHTYHQTAPSGKKCDPTTDAGMSHDENFCKAPGAIVLLYYSVLPFIGGVFFAGPDLTPTNVTQGLQAYPTTRYGGRGPTSDPRPALVGAGPGKHGFIVDAIEWRWRRDFTSPDPEKKPQWAEYPDCQRHYLNWPDELAPNWEKDGPHYNAWCGDPKTGYPRLK